MSARRVRKQLFYLGLAVAFVGLVGGGLFFGLTEPAPATPTPTPPPAYQALVIETVEYVQHTDSIDAVARVRNPNARAGVKSYPVTFVVRGSQQQEITRATITSFVLPGSLQFIVGLKIPVQQSVTTVDVEVPPTPLFSEIPATMDLPNFGVFLRTRSRRVIGSQDTEQQVGIIRNASTFNFQRVELVAVAHDAAGQLVGVGKTFVGELKVGEQREFTVQWPAVAAQTSRVTTLPSVNIFLEENIIKTIGDPRTLQ